MLEIALFFCTGPYSQAIFKSLVDIHQCREQVNKKIYPGFSRVHLISWQIFLKLWCELASGLPRVRWKSMTETPEYGNSILIPATLTLLFYLLFVTCLGYAWHIARQKERYFSCALMHFAVKHTAVHFVKAGRQPSLFVWGISPSEARNNVQDSSNSRNATCNFYELLKELNKLFPWDHFSWKAVFLSNFFFFSP